MISSARISAQSPADAGYTVAARGPMEKLWAKITWLTNKDDVVAITNSSFTEIANGLEFWDDKAGEWKDARNLIELQPDGTAAALHGRCKAYFKQNLNAPDAITLIDSNRVFKASPIGLFYYDAVADKTIRLASFKEPASAELLPPNQVVWKSVLDSINADYRVTYTKGAIEAELILLERPKPPEAYKLKNETTCLEVWTAWDAPRPVQSVISLKPEIGFTDSLLDFGGGVILARGRAFSTVGEPSRPSGTPAPVTVPNPHTPGFIPVGKSWNNVDNSSVLVESACWTNVAPLLASLPEMSQVDKPAAKDRLFCMQEAVAPRTHGSDGGRVLLASTSHSPRGVSLDFLWVNGGTDKQFGDGTYPVTFYVTNGVSFTGTVTLCPQSTLKYAPNTYMLVSGPNASFVCNCSSANASTLTSRDDDVYGQVLPDSQHSPTQSAFPAVMLSLTGVPELTISGARVRWATYGVIIDDYDDPDDLYNFRYSSFEFCGTGVEMGSDGNLDMRYSTYCNVSTPLLTNRNTQVFAYPVDICSGNRDSDWDGFADQWEYQYFGHLGVVPNDDADGDCLSNLGEYQQASNPTDYGVAVVTDPADQVVHENDPNTPATFSVTTSPSCPKFQWWASFSGGPLTAIAGATNSSYTVQVPGAEGASPDTYRCWPSNISSVAQSSPGGLYSLDNLRWSLWTNFIANSNSTSIRYQATHTHPTGWPTNADPNVSWTTDNPFYGKPGYTAISLCNGKEMQWESTQYLIYSGQTPITALTDRIGYCRGHGIAGPRGLHTPTVGPNDWAGTNVWFCDQNNTPRKIVIGGAWVGNPAGDADSYDFTLVFFETPVSSSGISHILYVMEPPANWNALYHIRYQKSQSGYMDVNIPGFTCLQLYGDSGGAILLPLPQMNYSLAFVGGIDTAKMTSDSRTNIQGAMTELYQHFLTNGYPNLNSSDFQLNLYTP